ncbi:MAG: aminotransferase class V-fold PLP-dependent enzyme [Ilumatobacteraceae bacterium]
MIDLDRVRADTVGVDDIVHLNNCGSSLPPAPVVDAQVAYLRSEQRSGGVETAAAHQRELDDFHVASAEMLGCAPDEIAFQPNAAEAWWRAFLSMPLRPGDRVLASRSEYQGNAFALMQARARGVIVDVVPHDDAGDIDLGALETALDRPTALVCLTQIAMSNGAVQPAAAVGRLCRSAGVPFLVDAVQTAGQRPIDVDEIGCDFLAYTGRKFMRGPRGTGALYARRDTVDRLGPSPFVDGRSATWTGDATWEHTAGAARFEWGERSHAAQIGLAVATRYALDIGLDAIADRVVALAAGLRDQLGGIDGVTVCDQGRDRCGIVTFTVDGVEADEVRTTLSTARINVGAPAQFNAQWDLGRREIDAVVRAGIHYFNTTDELARLVDGVADIARSTTRPRR